MGKFLIALSGARPDILDQCPSERAKFQSLGWAILITSTMAVISMWFALTSVMGYNPILMFPLAVIWGLVIMGIDRWLIISMPADGSRRFAMALPRLLLALLLGTVISTPIVLRVFQSEINNQISIMKENSEASFLSSQQHSQIAARVTYWTKAVNNLQQVIDSRGQQAINPASDPQIQSWNKQLTTERSVAASDYKQWQCQLYGGCGAPKGSGPLANASKARYQSDQNQINTLTGDIAAREKQLQDTSAAAQSTRLAQAQGALPNAKAQLQAAQAEENSLTSNFESTNNATNGLLIRLQALDQLSSGNGTLNMARFLLFLLFLLIECLPVTVKLLQRPGNYERIAKATAKRELNKAHQSLREAEFRDRAQGSTPFSPGPAPGGFTREPPPPGGADDAYARTQTNAGAGAGAGFAGGGYAGGGLGGADSIDTEIGNIWRTGARTGSFRAQPNMNQDSWQSSAPPGSGMPPPYAAADNSGPTRPNRQEEALHNATDLGGHGSPNGDAYSSGIEDEDLYGDDEI